MYTIKQIERALGVLNIDEVSPGKDTDNGDFIEKLNNRLEIDLAIKKTTNTRTGDITNDFGRI